jgi:carbon-monoxide dehydrogenase medium subunit
MRCSEARAHADHPRSCSEYHRPRTLAEAWDLHSRLADPVWIAGGTDLLARKAKEARPFVSLRGIEELRGVETAPRETRIGATTTISELVENREILLRYPVLAEAGRALASQQIRNVATLGGNLGNASPCADTATPLRVLGARARIASASGAREVPLEDFFRGPGKSCLAPGELLTAVLLPAPRPGVRATFQKKGRVRMDIAIASASVLLVLEGGRCREARVAVGSLAPTPLRLSEVESLLEGEAITPALLAEVEAATRRAVRPITDIRASADYRRTLAGVLVKRAVERLAGRES